MIFGEDSYGQAGCRCRDRENHVQSKLPLVRPERANDVDHPDHYEDGAERSTSEPDEFGVPREKPQCCSGDDEQYPEAGRKSYLHAAILPSRRVRFIGRKAVRTSSFRRTSPVTRCTVMEIVLGFHRCAAADGHGGTWAPRSAL
ncbi:hypothetical protein [Nocardia sp. CA-119907]|uniref:hypothetical protein n=1 Tax=Nocardia sp. CA-119907 TaxID=3239973 RepID=UPI003D975683